MNILFYTLFTQKKIGLFLNKIIKHLIIKLLHIIIHLISVTAYLFQLTHRKTIYNNHKTKKS